MLGVGWNFLFTGSTTLALSTYRPEEKDKAQARLNFCVFTVLALSSLASGVLVTTQGWTLLKPGLAAAAGADRAGAGLAGTAQRRCHSALIAIDSGAARAAFMRVAACFAFDLVLMLPRTWHPARLSGRQTPARHPAH